MQFLLLFLVAGTRVSSAARFCGTEAQLPIRMPWELFENAEPWTLSTGFGFLRAGSENMNFYKVSGDSKAGDPCF